MKMKNYLNTIFFKHLVFMMILSNVIMAFTYNKNVYSATNALKENAINTMKINDEATISLPSDPTSGYDWYVSYFNSEVLKLLSNDYAPSDNPKDSSGVRTFTFRAVSNGSCILTFKYHGQFEENNTSDTKTVVYNIAIGNTKYGKRITLQENTMNIMNTSDQAFVSLDSFFSTDYKWHAIFSKPDILKLVSNNFILVDANMPESCGKQNFIFKALNKGCCTITFKYYGSNSKTVVYDITVN